MRFMHLINASLLALLFLGSAWAWPQLPESIPAHFGADGRVTRWSSASLLSWFAMPLIALGLTSMNYTLAQLLPRRPQLINLPNKEQFLSLPPERQAPVIERMREMLYGISAPLIVLIGSIQLMTYRTAQGESSERYMLLVLLGTVLMAPLILVIWLPRIRSELDRQLRGK